MSEEYIKTLISNIEIIIKETKKIKNNKELLKKNKKLVDELLIKEYKTNDFAIYHANYYYTNNKLINDRDLYKICENFYIEACSLQSSLNFDIVLKFMISYPNLNLLKDSDVDLGIMVKNLDNIKLYEISIVLFMYGYEYKGKIIDIEPLNISSCKNIKNNFYCYRFEKIVNNKKIEIKVKDFTKLQTLINLDNRINNLTRKEYTFWTYHNYLLKKECKINKNIEIIYNEFKLILYYYYLVEINNTFLLC